MVEVRSLDLGDPVIVAALVALQRASYAVEAELIGTDDLPPLRETAAELATTGETFLGAYAPELAGAVSWKRKRGVLDIHRLVVHPDRFRQGIASALLEAIPRARRVIVATAASNHPALALYRRLGFRIVAERIVPPGVQIVELERRRRLSASPTPPGSS